MSRLGWRAITPRQPPEGPGAPKLRGPFRRLLRRSFYGARVEEAVRLLPTSVSAS
jgi:hypothetical protein